MHTDPHDHGAAYALLTVALMAALMVATVLALAAPDNDAREHLAAWEAA